MPIKILMPALSPTMSEGSLASWIKKEGDEIKAGEVIAEIETDKATMEVEAVDEGVLAKILVPSGTEGVAVNSVIAVILEEGETEADLEGFITEDSVSNQPLPPVEEEQKKESITEHVVDKVPVANDINSGQRVFASPLARRIASMKNIDLSTIAGSGPKGRIVKADVESYQGVVAMPADMPKPGSFEMLPISSMRKVIAQRLSESKQTVPHFYLTVECILDKVMEARAAINNESRKISVNDFVVKASSMAMRKVPEVNVSWTDQGIKQYKSVDISVAVAIDGGLITPIVTNADYKALQDVSAEIKMLVKRAKEGSLKPEEYQGGGFSISNLGMYGVKQFNAIINPPQSCILAVGAGAKRAVIIDDAVAIRTVMDVTLSCDHRAVDGAACAEFLRRFKDYIENPIKLFVE